MKLHQALEENKHAEAINIINDGADIEDTNEYGTTPLHLAVYKGYTDVVELLLDRDADINATNDYGDTPLHFAAWVGDTNIVDILLLKGANIDAIDSLGDTPLHNATCKNNKEIVNVLLNNRANIGACNNFGKTPLKYAIYDNNKSDKLNGLTVIGMPPIPEPKLEGFTDLVELLLDRGANIHDITGDGNTPLHLAVWEGYTDVVELLLNRGANIHAITRDGNELTPLHIAASEGYTDVVELLINKGAEINAVSYYGETPLKYAIDYNDMESNRWNGTLVNGIPFGYLECIKHLTKGSVKEFIELNAHNDEIGEYLKKQYKLATSSNDMKSSVIYSAKALFGMETTLKAKALLKIKIGALRSGVKNAYINTLKFLHYFIRFDLTAENINHIIGYVGLYDAKVDLNDIMSDLSPKLSSAILGKGINPVVLKQTSTAIKVTDVTCYCTIS